MKIYVYIIIIISIILNIAIFLGVPNRFISISSINFNELDSIKEDLDTRFEFIIKETNSDIVWVSLFHSISGRALRNTEIFILPSLRFDPLYESTLHSLTRNPSLINYQPRFSEPILAINRISETLSGNCISQVMPINNKENLGISDKKFSIRCPLIYQDKVVGSYGIIISDIDLLDLNEKSNSLTEIVKSYNSSIVTILFK